MPGRLTAIAVAVALALVGIGALGRWDLPSLAQEGGTPLAAGTPGATMTPTPAFSATLVAAADVGPLPAGAVALRIATYTVPPGTEVRSVADAGAVLIRVQAGSVTLDAPIATVSRVVVPTGILELEPAAPAAAVGRVVVAGEQVLLPNGVGARFRNDGQQPATLVAIALAPDGAATPVSSQAIVTNPTPAGDG